MINPQWESAGQREGGICPTGSFTTFVLSVYHTPVRVDGWVGGSAMPCIFLTV